MNDKVTLCVDCDKTLLVGDDTSGPYRHDVVAFVMMAQLLGLEIYVWSGLGLQHAEDTIKALNLTAKAIHKGSIIPDIAVDDSDRDLGKINIYV